MISAQILQSTIDGLKGITRIDYCICDIEGKPLVTTFALDTTQEAVSSGTIAYFAASPAESQTIGGVHFFKIFDEQQLEYILIVQGSNEAAYTMGKVAAYQIEGLLVAYKERFDQDNFIKNLLLDNMLRVDTLNRAKKLQIDNVSKRVVYIVETTVERDIRALEAIRDYYGSSSTDFVTAVDETSIIVVKDVESESRLWHLDRVGELIIEALEEAGIKGARVAFGTVVNELKDVSKSYKEASMALSVGKTFYPDENLIAYAKLGIGRLIFMLPPNLCHVFISEIFEGRNPDDFDEETITTINKFFENSLNVSETSRQLYIHRNTLVYRLDKIQKTTNLDLRVFEDAITFKLALMVVKYLKFLEKSKK